MRVAHALQFIYSMHKGTALVAIGLLGVGCTVDVTVDGAEGLSPVAATGLDAAFERVGQDMGVPADLLEAIGYTETRWQNVTGTDELDASPMKDRDIFDFLGFD